MSSKTEEQWIDRSKLTTMLLFDVKLCFPMKSYPLCTPGQWSSVRNLASTIGRVVLLGGPLVANQCYETIVTKPWALLKHPSRCTAVASITLYCCSIHHAALL